MAVVQISKIQARRGLQQDLPQLSSAEFGWSVDSQRLYIGNGTIAEGAPMEGVTEVITQKSLATALPELANYTFKGNVAGDVAVTGVDLNHPIVRSFQAKLDEIVNVKDFGALGDGSTDDTAAINRAITQIYYVSKLSNYTQLRRTIFFPAGLYIVTGDVIRIPPWCRIVGEGMQSTIIRQTDSTQSCLFSLVDSAYQSGGSLGSGGATLPSYIKIESLTLENTSVRDILLIDSARHVLFDMVEFKGSLTDPTSPSDNYCAVRFEDSDAKCEYITFSNCRFSKTRYLMISDAYSKDIIVTHCHIYGVYQGIVLGQYSASASTTPGCWRITNTTFERVATKAIWAHVNVFGVVSCGNNFINVGNNYAGVGHPADYIISFEENGNYSIADNFDRNDADDGLWNRVKYESNKNITIQANIGLTVGTATIGTGDSVLLSDNQTSFTSTGITLRSSCVLNYSIVRNGTLRVGTLMFTNSGSDGQYTDNYVSPTSDEGVTLMVNNSSVLMYRTSSTGYTATLKYNINYF